MRTFIFVLALTAFTAPILAAGGDAVACATPLSPATQNCNLCISASDGTTPLAQCFDCKAGYFLTVTAGSESTTGACTRCDAGKGIAAGGASAGTAIGSRPATKTANDCTACHVTCNQCFLPASDTTNGAKSCSRCAVGTFAAAAAANVPGYPCSGTCGAGKTRDVANTDLTGPETENTICVNCHASCAECKGTAATSACTKCAAGYYLSPAANANALGTCTACDDGKGKNADMNAFTANNQAATKDTVCKACTPASNCGVCSEATPAVCITCPSGKTLQADKTCNTPTTGGSNTNTTGTTNTTNTTQSASASVVQVVCGAFLAAYALL